MKSQTSLEYLILISVSVLVVVAAYFVYIGLAKSEREGLNQTVNESLNTIKNWANA